MVSIAFAVAEVTFQLGWLAGVDEVNTDLWHRVSGERFKPQHVVLVEVDDPSLQKYEDPLVFWAPVYARALKTLREAGAKVIGLDFLLTITPEPWLKKYNLTANEALKNYDLSFRQELNAGKTVLAGATRPTQGDDDFTLPIPEYLLSLPNSDLGSYIGLADLTIDPDGAIRRLTFAPKLKLDAQSAKSAPRLTLSALMAVHAHGQKATASEWQIAGRRYETNSKYPITFAGPPGTFPRVPIHKVLDEKALQDPAVLALKDKVIIIGGNFEGMNDAHDTPYSVGLFKKSKVIMTGPEIQANIAETLMSGRATIDAPDWLRVVITLLALFAPIAIGLRTSPLLGLPVICAGILISLALGYFAFQQFILFPSAHMQVALIAGFFMVLGSRLTREERDKASIRRQFEGYASDDVVNLLLDGDSKLDLKGQSMNITVLFSDIRNFTTITEKLTAHETVEFLNAYFPRIIDIIKAEGGRIDKFIGDAVMAEFGAPYPFPDHAARGLRAAARMRTAAADFKGWMDKRFPDRGIPDFAIGIGIHTGNAVVGEIGTDVKKEFTAIGDTVNVASRLEGETKTLSCVIVASADTVRAAGGIAVTGKHDTIPVKGRAKFVEVYEILDVKA